MTDTNRLSSVQNAVLEELESIIQEAEDQGVEEETVLSWSRDVEDAFDLTRYEGKVNSEDLDWLLERLGEIDTRNTLPSPLTLYNNLRKRWQSIVARHPWSIAHRHESKGTEIFHSLMAWAWEFDDIIGHLNDESLGKHIRDRRDVGMMISWIDELGDLLDEPENRQTLKEEERQAINETPAGSNPELPPFLLPFRAQHLLEELDYLHQQQDQLTPTSRQTLDSPLDSARPTPALVSTRLLQTVYRDLEIPTIDPGTHLSS